MSPIQHQITVMFVIMALGFLCGKLGLIDDSGNKKLSKVSLWIVNPLLIFMSYQSDRTPEITKNLFLTLGITAIVFALQIALALLIIPKRAKECAIERMSLIFTNCGFMGIPLVDSVFGSEGVIYLTMFVTVFNVLVWTYGVAMMIGKMTPAQALKKLCTPTVFSVILGLLFYALRIKVPDIIAEPLNSVSSMNTPLAMLIAGSTLAGTDFLKGLKNPKLYLLVFLRLIVFPALSVLSVFWLAGIGVDSMLISVVIIAASCPTAVITTMLAHTYERNSAWASQIFAVSTLLSIITIPAVMRFLDIMVSFC